MTTAGRYSATIPYCADVRQDGIFIAEADGDLEIGWWWLDERSQEIDWEIDAFLFSKRERWWDDIAEKWFTRTIVTAVTPKSNITLWTLLRSITNAPAEQHRIHERLVEHLLAAGEIHYGKEDA